MGGFAWVTLATNDSYSLGALVLAHSLKRVGTKHDLAVLVTPGVTGPMREKLSTVFSLVQEVNVLDSKDEANLALLARPELGITFTKLHCWRLAQYEKCVFVDADTLVIRNCDELFEREELSAAPDVGWPDCFNSGVFVFKPSQQTFASLTSFAAAKGSFDGGDQGLLNQYFSDWSRKDISKHLPFIYNMCSTATYSYLPAFKQFGEDVRIIHFIGITKPWLQYFDTVSGQVQPAPGSHHLQPLLQLWWNIFCENVHPELSPIMASSTLAQHWHESTSRSTFSNHLQTLSHDSMDSAYVGNVEVDFSEFQDPWENYREPLCIGSFNAPIKIGGENDDKNNNGDCDNRCWSVKNDFSSLASFESKNDDNVTEKSYSEGNNYEEDRKVSSVLNRNEDIGQFLGTRHPHFSLEKNDFRLNDGGKDTQNFNELKNKLESLVVDDKNNGTDDTNEFSKNHHENHCDCSFEINHRQINDICHRDEEKPRNHHHHHRHHHHHHSRENERESENDKTIDEKLRKIHFERNNDEDRLENESLINFLEKPSDESNKISQSHPVPCTNSKSVTTQSEMNITRQLEIIDAGIAGALAKITLGEARSIEQVAFEEHMRKQSWEQGQIDYMGRDSFENIWKKISETLSVQPERQPSPPKSVLKPEKSAPVEPTALPDEEKTAAKSEAAVLLETQEKSSTDQICELVHDVRNLTPELSEEKPELTTDESKLESLEKSSKKVDARLESSPSEIPKESPLIPTVRQSPIDDPEKNLVEAQKKPEDPQIATAGLVETQVPIQVAESVLEADVKESVTEDARPITEEAVSSISLMAQESVPAVLETAIEAQIPIAPRPNGSADFSLEIGNGIDAPSLASPGEVRTATIPTVERRSEAPSATQTSLTPSQTTTRPQKEAESPLGEIGGHPVPEVAPGTAVTLPAEQREKLPRSIPEAPQPVPMSPEAAEEPKLPAAVLPVETPLDLSPKTSESSSMSPKLIEEPKSSEATLAGTKKSEGSFERSTGSGATSTKPHETVPSPADPPSKSGPKISTKSKNPEKPDSATTENKTPLSCPIKPGRKVDLTIKTEKPSIPMDLPASDDKKVEGAISESVITEESPVRPTRTKDLQIPDTPTVTEPTPPTSPPIVGGAEGAVEQPTTKVTKKVVKKVVKKTSGTKTAEGSNEPESEGKKVTKKIVKKVVKKKEDEDGGESASGLEKPKKIVKVVKKTTKTAQTLGAEAIVPETPPPGSTEVPVPPKRKVKTASKTTKSDSEP